MNQKHGRKYLDPLDTNLSSRYLHRQRMLNTFVRSLNDAGIIEEFKTSRAQPGLADLNNEFNRVQYLDWNSDNEKEEDESICSLNSDDYSWMSFESSSPPKMTHENSIFKISSVSSITEFSGSENSDIVYEYEQNSSATAKLATMQTQERNRCQSGSVHDYESCDISPLSSDHSKTHSNMKTQRNVYSSFICSPTKENLKYPMKRLQKLDVHEGRPQKVIKSKEFEYSKHKTLHNRDQSQQDNIITCNKSLQSNSNMDYQYNNKLIELFPTKMKCYSNQIRSFPSKHPNKILPLNEIRSLVSRSFNSNSSASDNITVETNFRDYSEQNSSSTTYEHSQKYKQMSNPYNQDYLKDNNRIQNFQTEQSVDSSHAINETFNFFGDLKISRKNVEQKFESTEDWPEGYHVCKHCQVGFGSLLMYTVHIGFHSLGNPFRCRLCGTQYQNKVDFYTHITYNAHAARDDTN